MISIQRDNVLIKKIKFYETKSIEFIFSNFNRVFMQIKLIHGIPRGY